MIGDTTHDLQMAVNAGCAERRRELRRARADGVRRAAAAATCRTRRAELRDWLLDAMPERRARRARRRRCATRPTLAEKRPRRAVRRVCGGAACRAFAVRYDGRVARLPQPLRPRGDGAGLAAGPLLRRHGRDGWCAATHGAVYEPDTGHCAGGPCRGGRLRRSSSTSATAWCTGILPATLATRAPSRRSRAPCRPT